MSAAPSISLVFIDDDNDPQMAICKDELNAIDTLMQLLDSDEADELTDMLLVK